MAKPYRKTYVDVTAYFSADGLLTPRGIHWEDGRKFTVDRMPAEGRKRSRALVRHR